MIFITSLRRFSRDRAQLAVFLAIAAMLSLALLFGGASRLNLLQVAGLELFSLPLLGFAIWTLAQSRRWPTIPSAVLLGAAALPLLQLTPLPFDLWARLPGHFAAAQAARLAGVTGWRSYSLAPQETWRGVLALAPPAAVFFGAAALPASWRKGLTIVILAMTALSLLIGLGQISGGEDSPLYLYQQTNKGSAVGLFANRNHQAALLLVALPLAALWFDLGGRRRGLNLLYAAAGSALVLVTIVGLVIIKSRAGVLLMGPAVMASLASIWRGRRDGDRRGLLILAGTALVALALATLGLGAVLDRFQEAETTGRGATLPIILKTAWSQMPLGSGFGSFPAVYASVEPVELMNATFLNHAHDDWAEVVFDGGVPAALLMLGFLAWWARAALSAWRASVGRSSNLARAGAIVTGLLLVHSLVDYPLRTLALACVFAFACALMVPAPDESPGPS